MSEMTKLPHDLEVAVCKRIGYNPNPIHRTCQSCIHAALRPTGSRDYPTILSCTVVKEIGEFEVDEDGVCNRHVFKATGI